jgi:hypothetical protein
MLGKIFKLARKKPKEKKKETTLTAVPTESTSSLPPHATESTAVPSPTHRLPLAPPTASAPADTSKLACPPSQSSARAAGQPVDHLSIPEDPHLRQPSLPPMTNPPTGVTHASGYAPPQRSSLPSTLTRDKVPLQDQSRTMLTEANPTMSATNSMAIFAGAKNTTVNNSTFTNIGGDATIFKFDGGECRHC